LERTEDRNGEAMRNKDGRKIMKVKVTGLKLKLKFKLKLKSKRLKVLRGPVGNGR
jgi:hypothetical protein